MKDQVRDALGAVRLVAAKDDWSALFEGERRRLQPILGAIADGLQHYGSTAVPHLKAKPVIDMMAPIPSLPVAGELSHRLAGANYVAIDAGFVKRAFYRRSGVGSGPAFHLHLVVSPRWPVKNELILRDWLIANPSVAREYENLKSDLARRHPHDMPAYTAGKSAFLRVAVDDARASLGLPPEVDWVE